MQLRQLLAAACLLPGLALAARKGAGDAFTKWHARAVASTPLHLDDSNYNSVTAAPRDYGVAVVHTALGAQYGCRICQEMDPEWQLLANSWMKGDKDAGTRTLFGTIDFSEGRQSFQQLSLETAPVIIYYPPTAGPNASPSADPVRFDFSPTPPTAEQLHAWLLRHVPGDAPKPALRRPINWLRVGSITTLVLGAGTGAVVAWPLISWLISSRNLWASLSIVAILLFTSGHMFNSIRGTQYIAGDGKGGIQYFAPGFQNQHGLESQIVAAMYGLLAFSTIALALQVPRIKDPRTQTVFAFVWCGVSYGMYSFLISVFRLKQSGYPYALPPFFAR